MQGKVKFLILGVIVIILILIFFYNKSCTTSNYGVYIGLVGEEVDQIENHDEVVIDAMYFSKDEIASLKQKGSKVYSYMNLGSLEDFRPYYERYESITLADYENWEGERWVDVTKTAWHDFIVFELSKQLLDNGADGLFIDNIDVYYLYDNPETFEAIINILKSLKETHEVSLILNGGESFVEELWAQKKDLKKIFDGVNLESVATRVNFETDTYEIRFGERRDEKIAFLNKLKSSGIQPYVIEYSREKNIEKEMKVYYEKQCINYYIADDIELK